MDKATNTILNMLFRMKEVIILLLCFLQLFVEEDRDLKNLQLDLTC